MIQKDDIFYPNIMKLRKRYRFTRDIYHEKSVFSNSSNQNINQEPEYENFLYKGVTCFYKNEKTLFSLLKEYFSSCKRSDRVYCQDFLAQIEYFSGNYSALSYYLNTNPKKYTVFRKLFRSFSNQSGLFGTRSCPHSLNDIIDVAIWEFIKYIENPFRCLKRPQRLSASLGLAETVKSNMNKVEKELLTKGRLNNINNDIACMLRNKKVFDLFRDALTRPTYQHMRSAQIWKMIAEFYNTSNESLISLYNISLKESRESEIAGETSSLLVLFKRIPGIKRKEALSTIRRLAHEGVEFAKRLYSFGSLLGIRPFHRDPEVFKQYMPNHDGNAADRFLLGLGYYLGIIDNMDCDLALQYVREFVDHSSLMNPSLLAEKFIEQKEYHKAKRLYEYLSLLGNSDAIWNAQAINSYTKTTNEPLYRLIEFSNDNSSKHLLLKSKWHKSFSNDIITNYSQSNPYAAFRKAWKCKTYEESIKYLDIVLKLKPESQYIIITNKIIISVYHSIKSFSLSHLKSSFSLSNEIIIFISLFLSLIVAIYSRLSLFLEKNN